MAIQFPAQPYEDQQLFHNGYTWIWNGAQWDLLASSTSYVTPTTLSSTLSSYATQAFVTTALTNTASVSVSDTTPSVTTTGSLWFNSNDGSLYVYYNDGVTTQWIQPAVSNYGSSSAGGSSFTLTAATTLALGGVIIPAVGTSGITNTSGTIGIATATTSQKGAVIVDGTTITITSGVISAASRSLSSLTDVNVTGVSDGQVLKYNTAQAKWIAAPDLTGAGGTGIALSSLSVSISAPAGTGALTYDNSIGVFTFIPPLLSSYATTASLSSYATTASLSSYATTASLSSYATTASLSSYATTASLTALIPSQATHAGQYLSTNGTSLSWQSIATSLSALSDVNVTSVADGQVLKYSLSQGKWIPAADLTASGGGGVALTSFSVSTSSASGSGALSYNDTTGVFIFTPPSITTYTLPTATAGTSSTGTLGGVKVDGTSITINSGVISGAIGSIVGSGYISVNTVSGVATVSTTLTRFRSLDDSSNVVVNGSGLTIDRVAIHAVATYDVLAVNPVAYTFLNFFSTQNPTIYALSGTTIAFNLQVPGHPTVLQTTGGVDLVWTTINTYGTLVHVSETGVVSTGANAMGQVLGTLYWNINPSFSGTVRYQCTLHPAMRGNIVVKSIVSLA
jgi:plastocyanin